MRFVILGAGGVGSYYGGVLARAGHRVALVARGEHLEAIAQRGLIVQTPEETFTVSVAASEDPTALGPADFAIIAVKNYSLGEIAGAARHFAESGTTILPLLNGVEAADRLIASGVPKARVLGGMTEISAVRLGPGIVARRSPFQRIAVGEFEGPISTRVEQLVGAFRDAGVDARASTEILADLWRKLAFIASVAAACGLARSSVGPIRKAPLGHLLFERAIHEGLAVGRARGVPLAPEDEAKLLQFVDSLPDPIRPSFLEDLEEGHPTELDDLCGAISRLGRACGVETPVHDVATAALSVRAVRA